MLSLIAKLFQALNSESSSRQIAIAIALGMILGLTPTLSVHNLAILLLACLIRVNLSAFFVAFASFSLLSLALSTPFSYLGEYLLNNSALLVVWQYCYQFDLFKLAQLHHTLTLGALCFSVLMFMPVYLLSHFLVNRYRDHIQTFIERFKIVQAIKGSKFYRIYQGLSAGAVA